MKIWEVILTFKPVYQQTESQPGYAISFNQRRRYDQDLPAGKFLFWLSDLKEAQKTKRWKFEFTAGEDRRYIVALQAAARFLLRHKADFPTGFVPGNATRQAILAIKVYEVFLELAGDPENDQEQSKKMVQTNCPGL